MSDDLVPMPRKDGAQASDAQRAWAKGLADELHVIAEHLEQWPLFADDVDHVAARAVKAAQIADQLSEKIRISARARS